MRKHETFEIQTQDKELAQALVKGDMNIKTLRAILFGTAAVGATGSAATGGVVGVTGVAKLAAGSALAAAADPEPITKVILAVVAGICFIGGCIFLYFLVKRLIEKSYAFEIKGEDKAGNKIKIKGKPAKQPS